MDFSIFEHWEIALSFFLIAILYSSVGFGGGSSYLAILYLFGFETQMLRVIALMCNITVVSGGVYLFHKRRLLNWNRILPLVLISVPLAYFGGSIPIEDDVFFLLLSVALIIAAILMLIKRWNDVASIQSNKVDRVKSGVIGGGIGFLSGLVSIGGGIFLAPVLHLLKWDNAKVIASTASFFILVNSIAGLGGQLSKKFEIDWSLVLLLVCSVFLGGQIGSRLGSGPLSQNTVRKLTALLILFVGVRIGYKYLPLVL